MDRIKIALKSYKYGRNTSTLDNTISSMEIHTIYSWNWDSFGIRICLKRITN